MERTMNMGAFEALNQQEMLAVDGGAIPVAFLKEVAKQLGLSVATDAVKSAAKYLWNHRSELTGYNFLCNR